MQELITRKEKIKYIFLITVIFIVACLETDMYLPAFPDMMRYFHTSEAVIQSILSWNFVGICLSGPFYGPLSDTFGRKKILMTAMSLFVIGSIGTVFAKYIEWMLLWRVLQGLGTGGVFTIGTAIIYDKFHREEATKVVNDLNSVIPVIMALAPLIGGYLNIHYGFRSNFAFIALFSIFSLAVCAIWLKETLPSHKRATFNLKHILKDFSRAFLCFRFWGPTIIVGCIFAGYLSYISYASLLFVNHFHVSRAVFPFYQASVLISFVCASLSANPLIAKIGVTRLKQRGLTMISLGGAMFILFGLLAPQHYNLFHVGMIFYSFGAGWLIGPYFTESMEALPDIKGVAASLTTSFRLLFAASFIAVVSAAFEGSIFPLLVGFSFLFLIGAISLALLHYIRQD